MKKRLVLLVPVLLLLFLAMQPSQVRAQEETPTPTPTPAYLHVVPLASGNQLLIERRITYGEIAVTLSIGMLLLFGILFGSIRLLKLWLR